MGKKSTSQFCQFCDKELLFDFSVVPVDGYITCGAEPCVANAVANTAHYDKLQDLKDNPPVLEDDMVIFSSKTPDDDKSWRLVSPEDHPEFMEDLHVVAQMVKGFIVNKYQANSKNVTYYRAQKVKEIKKQLGAQINA